MSSPLQLSGRHVSSIELSPKKSEWVLMNQFKLMERQEQQQRERSIKKEKSQLLKEELDFQLNKKKEDKDKQKERDHFYYEELLRKDQELKDKEETERREKLRKYRNYQSQNKNLIDLTKSSRLKEREDFQQDFQIGRKSQEEIGIRKQKARRELLDSLDKQLKMKAQQKQRQKMENEQRDIATIKYLNNQFKQKERKVRNQNEKVYKYFSEINKEKQQKQKLMEDKLINRPREIQREKQEMKYLQKEREKIQKKEKIRDMLDHQVKDRRNELLEQKYGKKQDHSQSLLDHLFTQKPSRYNKRQYYSFLQKQVEQQKSKKGNISYMNQDQYRMNLNQLNKMTSGEYAHQKYVDRSIASIGEGSPVKKKAVFGEDSEIIKKNIYQIKGGR